ncbi:ATP-binding protein [Streptomyces phytohabitans]|uniref:ATP-binding protein n=1 Tax=Streptomyces phytohabitans TaxID=1150371 RepID=UPI00345C0689
MHEYMSRVRIWELTCPGLPEEVGRARRWTQDVLRDTSYADDVALIVSELGGNAVTHARSSRFRVVLSLGASALTVAVTDWGGGEEGPRVRQPGELDSSGRGLILVHLLAASVHITRHTHGHTATAHLLGRTTPGAEAC